MRGRFAFGNVDYKNIFQERGREDFVLGLERGPIIPINDRFREGRVRRLEQLPQFVDGPLRSTTQRHVVGARAYRL
jgi:hypothetical protein